MPDLAIASRGPVASVLLFASRPIADVRSIAMDISSRTSVALVRVLCARLFKIHPKIEAAGPDLPAMLGRCDAALIIGDNALFQPPNVEHRLPVEVIDLGQAWTELTGLPFVYAFWAGREGALEPGDVEALQLARDAGVAASDEVACAYLREAPERQALGMRYLRDNIKYHLGRRRAGGPGAVLPLRRRNRRRAACWRAPVLLMPTVPIGLEGLVEKVRAGLRLDGAEALELYRSAPTAILGALADGIRLRKHPDGLVTYIIDRNVNYTNICVAKCNFCAFYRPVGSPDGYVLGFDELFRKIDETIAVGGVQLLLQGGHNPDLPLSWYEDLFRAVKERYPSFKLHALSPPEVIHLSRLSQLPVPAVIERLIAAGLDSIPGGGAEILVDRVRKLLHCYGKATADEWLDVMRHAHRAGLRTTATMMYGTVETDAERIEHMLRLRDLQDETGGFTAFITWSYQPDHTELSGTEATGIDYLRTLAIARIVLDNFDNLQASWVTQGGKVGQLSLAYGANDMGSVMIEENVVRAAGASYCMDELEIVRNIEDAGFAARRRNMHYEVLGEPIFRERDVPRMLELATAREAGDTHVPDELRFYPARSRAGKAARP